MRGVRTWPLLGSVLVVVVLGAVAGAGAQPAGRPHRIGVLDAARPGSGDANLAGLRQGLRDLGYVEERDIAIEHRSAGGRAERLPDLAAELVRLPVDVIVTAGTPAALAARHVTGTIPIVMAWSGDPVFAGLVDSPARPGGNVTGLHVRVPAELAGRRLRLLKELVPRCSRVAVFLDPGDVYARLMMKEIATVAGATGVQVQGVEVARPEELDRAFEATLMDRADALIVLEGTLMAAEAVRIVSFARSSRLPAIYGATAFVDAGGLMAYGTDLRDLFRRSAGYVHRILRGARPAELAVEPPSKFELVINREAATAIGVPIPPSLLRRADRLID